MSIVRSQQPFDLVTSDDSASLEVQVRHSGGVGPPDLSLQGAGKSVFLCRSLFGESMFLMSAGQAWVVGRGFMETY